MANEVANAEKPFVSILLLTYNRRNFLPLIMTNLYSQTYPKDKLEVVIVDDGEKPLFLNSDEVKVVSSQVGIKINYIRDTSKHYTIGEKRNKSVKLANYKICACMDDDDIYFPSYIEYSVDTLRKGKYGLVGSPEMLFLYPHHKWKITGIRCESKRQIHEATMVFTKKHFNSMGGFNKKGNGEGAKLVDWNDNKCYKTEVNKCMICIAHKNNTVDKEMFKDKNINAGELDIELLKVVSNCIGIPLDFTEGSTTKTTPSEQRVRSVIEEVEED